MYNLVLILHSWIRWAAIVAGIGATFLVLTGQPSTSRPDSSDRWGLIFLITMDLQLLLGLLLYLVLSPTTAAIRENFDASMRDPVARFWAVEHVGTMLVAIVLVHVGRVLARKARTPGAKRMRLLVCFGIATIAMLAATPWPGMVAGRPFFRL
jgi:glucose uptake protein GlcU